MDKKKAKKRIEKLKNEINRHRYLYHVLDKQEISDEALDSLKNELFKLEQQFPDLVSPDSSTQRVGGEPLQEFEKVEHDIPMLSLFDAFSFQDMKDWEERLVKIKPRTDWNYYCELKLDGLAVSLKYNKGKFAQGATRGDGKIGEDVTQNLKTIDSIPLSLRLPEEKELEKLDLQQKVVKKILKQTKQGEVEVRGEAIMTKKNFQELNKKYKKRGKPELSNPRNGVAGSIRQLDPKIARERKMDFCPYFVLGDLGINSQEISIKLASLLGFKILLQNRLCSDLEEVEKFHKYWQNKRDSLPFVIDGVVVKINEMDLWPQLGVVGKGARYMMAYKFPGEQATTKVEKVIWQVGRTGVLTPTAVLKPVSIGGVTVSRATLHNMDEIKRLDLKVKDTVIVERAGDVIPKIVQVFSGLRDGKEKDIIAPSVCPMCGGKVKQVKGEVAYRCVNTDCYAVNLRKLIHWASRGALDIEGLGPKIIEQLVQNGLVRDIADFYTLNTGDLKPLERFADKSAENLVEAIQERKEIDITRFIYGLGIPHVGEETSLLLARNFYNHYAEKDNAKIKNLVKYFQKIDKEKLREVNDIGPIVAGSIKDWFQNLKNINVLEKLEERGVSIKYSEAVQSSGKLKGKKFVLTGSLQNLTREQAKTRIKELGGNISSSVSQNTDYVIAGSDPGNKYDKAKKTGVKIITENEILDLINKK